MKTPPRRGTAPLEFVLVFPLLLGFTTTLIWLGLSVTKRIEVLSAARSRSWEARDSANAGDVLKLQHDPEQSKVTRTESTELPKLPVLNRMSTSATTGTHFRYWGVEEAIFDAAGDSAIPHSTTLEALVGQNSNTLGGLQELVEKLRATPTLLHALQ